MRGLILAVLIAGAATTAADASKIRDIAHVQGVRNNQLVGYGLVVGLTGTGDKSGTGFTLRSVSSLLEAMGVTIRPEDMSVKNVAAVMVTATLPPFAREGAHIDVLVSSLGDAKSLKGGILVQTPVRGADGQTYAVAQGPLSLGGFAVEGPGGTAESVNHLTVARIPNGAIVEREVPMSFLRNGTLEIALNQPDFATANRMVDVITRALGAGTARALDAATVEITSPDTSLAGAVRFLSQVEDLSVTPSTRARVVINERTGTIVAGGEIIILPVAISHGNLSIRVDAYMGVAQPLPFSDGETQVIRESDVGIHSGGGYFTVLNNGTTLDEIAQALNAMGVTSRDMIAIFQAIKEAGALQAELVVL